VDVEKRWPRPSDDAERVAALRALGVLDHPADEDLEALVRVASYVCGTPSAAVNLIDKERQWAAALHGPGAKQMPRDESMCGWAILQPGVTYVPDASHDAVFADHPHVTGMLGSVRLYAAAPVVVASGFVVGTLCAYGEQPGQLSPTQIDRLSDLAQVAARILELRNTVDTVAQAAVRDPLTGLRNRSIFDQALQRALGLYTEGVGHPGVLYLDLNGFKLINDQHGHHAGDQVLKAVGARLRGSVRDTEVVARIGGDEFAIVVQVPSGEGTESRLRLIADRILGVLAAPITLDDGTEVEVGASIGLAVAQPGDSAEALLGRADAAMYAVKVPTRRSVDDRLAGKGTR
jgi:diguanylate cyclase (GGDEF)-like protein